MIYFNGAPERGLKFVIILLRNWIKLVIVTARALHSETENAPAHSSNHVVEVFITEFRIVFFPETDLRMLTHKTGSGESFVVHPLKLVAGQLFLKKNVVRFVRVERMDHIVAITPGIWAIKIVFVSIGIRIAGNIQPMPAPTFTVTLGSKQTVDQILPSLRRLVAQKPRGL